MCKELDWTNQVLSIDLFYKFSVSFINYYVGVSENGVPAFVRKAEITYRTENIYI